MKVDKDTQIVLEKVNEGFAESETTLKNFPNNSFARAMALKEAYRFLSPHMKSWDCLSYEKQIESLQDIFDLSDINFKYIMTGNKKIEE